MSDAQSGAPGQHFRQSVPASDRTSGWQIGLVIFGIGTTLPVFFLGAQLGQGMGLASAMVASIGGCLFLGALAVFTGTMGARTGLTSYLIIERAFGRIGARFINALMAITLAGYFAMTADILGRTICDGFRDYSGIEVKPDIVAFVAGALMTLTAVFGFAAIRRLSFLSVPLMCGCVGLAIYRAVGVYGQPQVSSGDLAEPLVLAGAVSTVAGMAIQMAVLMPDLSRFAYNAKHGVLAVWGLVFGFPVVLIAAAGLAILTHQTSIMLIMTMLGLGVPAILALVLATWTTNVINLYSASMTLATILRGAKEWQLTAGAGAVGTVAALLGVADRFVPFLNLLAITVPPIAAVYLADYFLVGRARYEDAEPQLAAMSWIAWIAWSAGCIVGFLTTTRQIPGTGMPVADSLIVAFVLFLGASKLLRRSPSMANQA